MIKHIGECCKRPTPGCVISRIASGRFLASRSTAAVNSSIVDSSGPATPTTLADVDWPKELTRVSLTVLVLVR